MDRILMVDDDTELCSLLEEFLRSEGFRLESVNEGEKGVERACGGEYALVILDVMLPGIGGFEVLRRIRAAAAIPVLMLTAHGEELDRILGLEMGADDYVPKPFNPRELVARIRAVLRRTRTVRPEGEPELSPVHSVGDVQVDEGTREVRRGGAPLELTGAEFNILAELLRNAGRIVSRSMLAEKALGRPLSPFDRSVDMHVSNLRKKLGAKVGNIERIKTVRGAGYIYANPEREGELP